MNTAIPQVIDTVRPSTERALTLANLVKRMGMVPPTNYKRPAWAPVSKRTWRRHSALLTYRHEIESGARG